MPLPFRVRLVSGGTPILLFRAILLALFLLGVGAAGLVAQIPPVVPVTIPLPDSLRAVLPDPEAGDAEFPPAREVIPRNVPSADPALLAGVERGIWEWDREGLLNAPAMTLHELVSFIPGVTMIRGGDIGPPAAVSAFGLTAGQIRIFVDGVEDPPLEGGVVDLAQIGLTGLERVRVERGPAELRIHLTTLQVSDARPLTLLEVGTGDLRTNLFRVGFAHPNALGGTLLVALDRLDSEGTDREEPGSIFGTRIRYSQFRGERLGLAVEYRSRTARRPEEPEGLWEPREVNRSDWSARLGWRISDALTAEFHGLHASIREGRERDTGTGPGGVGTGNGIDEAADTLLTGDPRTSVGGRLTWSRDPIVAWIGGERRAGDGWPSNRVEAGLAASHPLGGIALRWDREGWSDDALEGRDSRRPSATGAGEGWSIRAWSSPLPGISLFAEMEHARRGAPFAVPHWPEPPEEGDDEDEEDDPDPDENGDEEDEEEEDPRPVHPVRFAERDGMRVGARLGWRGAHLSGAWMRIEADRILPFDLPFDRGERLLLVGARTGFEVEGRIPLSPILDGLSLTGTGQFWESTSRNDDAGWRYLPNRSWTGAFEWYHTGYDGKLEIWTDIGVRGRDPMFVPIGVNGSNGSNGANGSAFEEIGLELTPFTQSWYGRIQFRVVTVRVFVQWENLTLKDDNADLIGRIQPQARVMYGVRWTMWN